MELITGLLVGTFIGIVSAKLHSQLTEVKPTFYENVMFENWIFEDDMELSKLKKSK